MRLSATLQAWVCADCPDEIGDADEDAACLLLSSGGKPEFCPRCGAYLSFVECGTWEAKIKRPERVS